QNVDGETVYHSKGYTDTSDNDDFLVRKHQIKGGWVVWSEDISAVNRINSELEEATERIEEENDLIEEENRFTAEKVRYETQNRLYDNIAEHTHSQLVEIDEALVDTDEFDLRMKFCLLLGTYVKRCSNLMLVADHSPDISTDELYLSINESFENMGAFGIDYELRRDGETKLPAAQIIAAYDLFEAVVELVLDSVSACSIHIMPSEHTLMTAETDCVIPDIDRLSVNSPELELSSFVEDDIQHIILSIGGGSNG
ncbi:MAG: hypothetical protein Q4A05_05480, partial [Ruminococcus sp.]|nr:hypothetical protein [Ruminococcus sp.]